MVEYSALIGSYWMLTRPFVIIETRIPAALPRVSPSAVSTSLPLRSPRIDLAYFCPSAIESGFYELRASKLGS